MKLEGHVVRRITASDAAEVQALFALDLDYWLRVEGAPLRETEAAVTLGEGPPGFPLDKKHAFLIDDVALLDMLEGYPDEQTWFLGLIFLAPAARGRGLGTKLMTALCDHVRANGGSKLRLAVEENHVAARRLYERLGFQFVVRRQRVIYTGATVELDVLELAL